MPVPDAAGLEVVHLPIPPGPGPEGRLHEDGAGALAGALPEGHLPAAGGPAPPVDGPRRLGLRGPRRGEHRDPALRLLPGQRPARHPRRLLVVARHPDDVARAQGPPEAPASAHPPCSPIPRT